MNLPAPLDLSIRISPEQDQSRRKLRKTLKIQKETLCLNYISVGISLTHSAQIRLYLIFRCALREKISNFTCVRHLLNSTAVTNVKLFLLNMFLLHTNATRLRLQYFITARRWRGFKSDEILFTVN